MMKRSAERMRRKTLVQMEREMKRMKMRMKMMMKQKLAKERRESETQRMKMRTMTMRTMIKSKTRAYRVTFPLPQTEKSPFYNLHHLCNLHLTLSSPTLSSVVEQDCTGWVGRVELLPYFSSPLNGTESPPPHFTQPKPRGSQAATTQHSTISLSTLFMYSRVRTLGLVSSFGSVLLIFCWMNSFLLLGLLSHYLSFFCSLFLSQ